MPVRKCFLLPIWFQHLILSKISERWFLGRYRTGTVSCLRNSQLQQQITAGCGKVMLLMIELWARFQLVVLPGEDPCLMDGHTAMVVVVLAEFDPQTQGQRGHHTMLLEAGSGCHLLSSCQWRFVMCSVYVHIKLRIWLKNSLTICEFINAWFII